MTSKEFQIKTDEKDELWDYIISALGEDSHKLGELVELEHELEAVCRQLPYL